MGVRLNLLQKGGTMKYLQIKQERLRRNWTQEYVAQQINLTRTAVHDIENGKQLPSYKILVKLEDLFEMGHRDLLKEVER